jgi:hypothetical protein
MDLKELAFLEGIPFEVYDNDPENWSNILIKLYLILYIENFSRGYCTPKKIELDEITFDKFDYIKNKIRKNIHLITLLHLGLPEPFICSKNRDMKYNLKFPIVQGNFYNSSQHIITYYSPGSGGNFLLNCFYFSDDISCVGVDFCEFFLNKIDINEIVMNIVNDVKVNYSEIYEFKDFVTVTKFNTVKEKLNYAISKTKSQITWTDPGLDLNFDEEPKYNFYVSHLSMKETINSELKIWPNCKTIIHFKNTRLFKNIRKYPSCFWWSSSDDTYKEKKTLLQFIEQPQENKQCVMDKLNDEIQINSVCSLDSKKTFYVWDTNWYFSEKDTLTHIKELYEILSLSGFNEDAISKYYNVWIKTMSDLKTKALNEVTK